MQKNYQEHLQTSVLMAILIHMLFVKPPIHKKYVQISFLLGHNDSKNTRKWTSGV